MGLAEAEPALRGAALRASIARLSVLEGVPCTTLAPVHEVPTFGPIELLESLLCELQGAKSERERMIMRFQMDISVLERQVDAERNQNAYIALEYQAERDKRRDMEMAAQSYLSALDEERKISNGLRSRMEQNQALIECLSEEVRLHTAGR